MTDYKCQEIDNIKKLTNNFVKVAENFIELKKEQENIIDTLGSDWEEIFVDNQERELAQKDLEDEQFCACGNYKMDESDFCEDCI